MTGMTFDKLKKALEYFVDPALPRVVAIDELNQPKNRKERRIRASKNRRRK